MSKTRFTPGPWEIDGEFNIRTVDKTNYLRGRGICTIGSFFSNINEEEVREQNLANAALIAASTEMYEIIGVLLHEIEYCDHVSSAAIEKACEVLKKAGGEE